ncbi:reticulocyte-binding protein 2 a [Corynascus novoguineensis]|uniref:Reticulocyte-binding protein 2 a n=1 Tax=Corynascus novoguineensis TaxID=1126955 RepID=A0AAN7CZ84_9PEZI|nr:reticulocyte-binding protein 2 a [Corynascus novoguineensis]
MSQPPPPPPPHGENPRTTAGGTGLPPGKYDVFIIPEHSAGSGFLYLPSLKPQWNSFIAGVVSTLAVVIMTNLASPLVLSMFSSPERMWSFLWATLVACVGAAAFLLGRHQNEPSAQQSRGGNRPGGYDKPGGGYGGAGSSWYTPPPQGGPSPNQAPPPPPPPPPQHEAPRDGGGQYQSWHEQPRQEPQPEPQPRPQPQPQPQSQSQPQRQPQPQPQSQPPPQPQAQPQSGPVPEPRPQEPKQEEPKPQATPAPEPKQQPQPPPPRPSSAKSDAPKGAWEKAREEMRRREEERKAKEAEAKKKEDTARRLRELREREARERERREREARERDIKEKLRQEQEAKERERMERELREKVERELREKLDREAKEREEVRLKEEQQKKEEERAQQERERQAAREKERKEREERLARLRREQEEKERKEKERKEKENTERKGTTYAYSSVGEKTSMWPNGKPPSVAPSQAASTPPPSRPTPSQAPPSPTKPAPSPTRPAPSPTKSAASATGTEDTYSFRPYDTPKKPTARKKSVSDFSESSWAPSASTARTTPPPSTRGPYTTNDPQKIVIKAVYGYLNQFSKTPASQLISGVAPVTDGLILRITSAGLFVDDDVRGVAQREWDIKAWTLKLVEIWCPVHAVSAQAGNTPGTVPTNHPFFKTMPQGARRGASERGATKTMLGEEAVQYIDEFGRTCNGNCRRAGAGVGSGVGAEKNKGLHLLRATIRDQEGKRFLFVVGEEEAWKIAGGLAALRGSSQVRALGVAGFSGMESRTLLDTLGWTA